jgi:hypothetical protein
VFYEGNLGMRFLRTDASGGLFAGWIGTPLAVGFGKAVDARPLR